MTRENSLIRPDRIRDWLIGALLLLTACLIADIVIAQLRNKIGSIKGLLVALAWLSPVVIFSLVALAFILRCGSDSRLRKVGLAIILASMLCRLGWISAFDSYQVNDFGFYVNLAADWVSTGKPEASDFCGEDYLKRSAFYTYPIVRLFGPSLTAIKLANVLMTTLTSWIFFRLGIALFGTRLAVMGLLFFIWQPDLWYSMTLASHDAPGMLWLAVFFWLSSSMQRRTSAPVSSRRNRLETAALSVLLGADIFFLDFTRTYHYAALLAVASYLVLETLRVFRRVPEAGIDSAVSGKLRQNAPLPRRLRSIAGLALFWLVLPIATYYAANQAFWKTMKIKIESSPSSLICEVTSMDVLGISAWEEIKDWTEYQCSLTYSEDRVAYAARKLMHDLTHDPRALFRYYQRKNRDLGLADDYLEWSTYAKPERWDQTQSQVKRINSKYRPEQGRAIALGNALVLLLVLWRLWLYPRIPFRRQEWIVILFSGSFYGLILLLLESQPRYDVFLIFLLSWMAAQGLDDLCLKLMRKRPPEQSALVPRRSHFYVGGALLLVVLAAAWGGISWTLRDGYFTLRDQSGFAPAAMAELPDELRACLPAKPVFVKNNYKALLLGYQPGPTVEANSVLAVQRTFAVRDRASHHLRFFISTTAASNEPFDMMVKWKDTNLDCIVAVNGKIVVQEKLNEIDEGNLYVSLTREDGVDFTRNMTIQFILRNLSRIGTVTTNRAPVAALEYIDLQ